jgi:hypothetical protein
VGAANGTTPAGPSQPGGPPTTPQSKRRPLVEARGRGARCQNRHGPISGSGYTTGFRRRSKRGRCLVAAFLRKAPRD